jgi:hypothetical protein
VPLSSIWNTKSLETAPQFKRFLMFCLHFCTLVTCGTFSSVITQPCIVGTFVSDILTQLFDSDNRHLMYTHPCMAVGSNFRGGPCYCSFVNKCPRNPGGQSQNVRAPIPMHDTAMYGFTPDGDQFTRKRSKRTVSLLWNCLIFRMQGSTKIQIHLSMRNSQSQLSPLTGRRQDWNSTHVFSYRNDQQFAK